MAQCLTLCKTEHSARRSVASNASIYNHLLGQTPVHETQTFQRSVWKSCSKSRFDSPENAAVLGKTAVCTFVVQSFRGDSFEEEHVTIMFVRKTSDDTVRNVAIYRRIQ
jgi:hypothetical protein